MKAGNLDRAVTIAKDIKDCEDLMTLIENWSAQRFGVHQCVDMPTFDAFKRATKTNLEKRIDELRAEALTL